MFNETTTALSPYVFCRLHLFLESWLSRTMASLQELIIELDGSVSVRDCSGWHACGTVSDWLPVAWALDVFTKPPTE